MIMHSRSSKPIDILPRAVVFDLDGLMVNTEELYQEVGTELLQRRGCLFESDLLTQMMGRPPSVSLSIMIEHHGLKDSVEELATESQEIFRTILDARLQPMPGLLELLRAMDRTGMPRGVATSSPPKFAWDVLRRVGLDSRIDFVLTCDDVVEGKPHPEVYLLAAQKFQMNPAEMMALEDSQNGCRAAVASGAFTVAIPGDHSRNHEFPGAQFIADSLHDARIYDALGLAGNPTME